MGNWESRLKTKNEHSDQQHDDDFDVEFFVELVVKYKLEFSDVVANLKEGGNFETLKNKIEKDPDLHSEAKTEILDMVKTLSTLANDFALDDKSVHHLEDLYTRFLLDNWLEESLRDARAHFLESKLMPEDLKAVSADLNSFKSLLEASPSTFKGWGKSWLPLIENQSELFASQTRLSDYLRNYKEELRHLINVACIQRWSEWSSYTRFLEAVHKFLDFVNLSSRREEIINMSNIDQIQDEDFYSLLGVDKDSPTYEAELKRSFRKLALKYHPDKCKMKYACMKMKRINGANDCLKDPVKRLAYDKGGESGLRTAKKNEKAEQTKEDEEETKRKSADKPEQPPEAEKPEKKSNDAEKETEVPKPEVPEPFSLAGADDMKLVVANFLKNGEVIAEEMPLHGTLRSEFDNLTSDDWLTELQDYVKDLILFKLSPVTKVKKFKRNGKKIVQAKGAVVQLSKVLAEAERLKEEFVAEELQIIGLTSVIIDIDLKQTSWHGTNILLVADQLIVHEGITWDVSGLSNEDSFPPASDGSGCGADGLSGKHGLPGESGGNVYIKFNQSLNFESLTVTSEGGHGGRGQDGGRGRDGVDGADSRSKMTKTEFKEKFPSTAEAFSHPSVRKNKKDTIKTNIKSTDYDLKFWNNDRSTFHLQGKTFRDEDVTISSFVGLKKGFVALVKGTDGQAGTQGGRGGSGGEGGEGGFSGAIRINDVVIPCKNVQATSGSCGTDGAGGRNGKQGKSSGDVGTIDWAWVSDAQTFYGYDCDRRLEIQYSRGQPDQRVCALCYPLWYDRWAFITSHHTLNTSKTCETTREEKNSRQREKKMAATKKKDILSADLTEVTNEIEQRKTDLGIFMSDIRQQHKGQAQLLQEIGEEISQAEEEKTEEMTEENVQVVKQFKKKEDVVIDNRSELVQKEFLNQRLTCKRCQSYLRTEQIPEAESKVQLGPFSMAKSLVKRRALSDTNNILHAIFGAKNSDDVLECRNWSHYRNELSDFVRDQLSYVIDQEVVNSIVEKFVGSFACELSFTEIHRELINFQNCKIQEWEELLRDGEKRGNESIQKWLRPDQKSDFNSGSNFHEDLIKCLTEFQDKVCQFLLPFPWEEFLKSTKGSAFLSEYSDFIRKEDNTLGWSELELIAIFYRKKIHIFEEEDSNLVHLTTLGHDSVDEHFLLLNPNEIWLPLDWDPQLKEFYEKRESWENMFMCLNRKLPDSLDLQANAGNTNFLRLLEFFKEEKNRDKLNAIKRLDPEFDVPDVFSKLLLEGLETKSNHLTVNDICHLVEKITASSTLAETGEKSVYFIWNMLANVCPHVWKDELLIRDMEDSLQHVFSHDERSSVKTCLHKLPDKLFEALKLKLTKMKPEKFLYLVKLMSADLRLSENDIERLEDLSLSDWIYELKTKFWEVKIENIPNIHVMSKAQKLELVHCILELEAIHGHEFCARLITDPNLSWKDLKSTLYFGGGGFEEKSGNPKSERSFVDILDIMSKPGQTLKIQNVQSLRTAVHGKSEFYQVEPVNPWAKKMSGKLKLSSDAAKFLSIYNFAVSQKMGFKLRRTQQLTILSVLLSKNNFLSQVSTGEGKSLIVAGIAIAKALAGQKVDILTSSNLLAIRDSSLTLTQGGLRDLYEMFDVTVDNNSHHRDEDRQRAYNCDVVYGELSNFQRDHLLQTFYGQNIKGSRQCESILVDEVDCMLLDNGNNILFLSHNIPGMSDLESVYVYIWEKVNLSGLGLEEIRANILYELMGTICKDDLDMILPEDQRTLAVKNGIWFNLVKARVISESGELLITDPGKLREFDFKGCPDVRSKLVYFFRNVLNRHSTVKVPKHLRPLVVQHLDTWLSNAVHAQLLSPDVHYVVDCDRSKQSNDFNSQVIIIDTNTGCDQSSSQWDGSLHQFLQLKEGCQITSQSLKAVFVSNVSYIQQYGWFSGLTGTLGSQQERDYLLDMYEADFQIIPTAFAKKFVSRPAKILTSKAAQMEAVSSEAKAAIKDGRSVIIFCEFIEDVKQYDKYLKGNNLVPESNLHSYMRNYEEFKFEATQLGPGHIILSTNLAGRGTDIKLSDALVKNGGLHVCITYLPDNIRIEEQAFGRAGRKGQPGSGILVLLNENKWENIFKMKRQRNARETKIVSALKENFDQNVSFQEKCFHKFSIFFKNLMQTCESLHSDQEIKNFVTNCALDRWALLLDSLESDLASKKLSKEDVVESLEDKLREMKLKSLSSTDLIRISSQSPSRRIQLAKHLATKKEPDFSVAKSLLNKLIKEDEFWYPQAHYYKAFIMINESEKSRDDMDPILRELATADKLLDDHIQLQMTFASVVTKISDSKKQVLFTREFYKEQKENVIHLFEILKGSIGQIWGTPISSAELASSADFSASRAEEVFQALATLKLINNCQLTPSSIIPDEEKYLLTIANDFGILCDSLEQALKNLPSNKTEKGWEKALKSSKLLSCTRKTFWDKLVSERALVDSQDCLIIPKDLLPDNLKGVPQIQPDPNHFFYNPVASLEDLKEKLILKKADVKTKLGSDYKEKKKNFESNRIAKLDIDNLRKCDLSAFGMFSSQDLIMLGIDDPNDIEKLIKCLLDQGFIDELKNYQKPFEYPDCQLYESDVESSLQQKFVASRIKKQWVDKDNEAKWKALNDLALKPYRTLLMDLIDAKIISQPRVKVSASLEDSEGLAGMILNNFSDVHNTFCDKEEQKKIMSYLRGHQASYASLETIKASLSPLETRLEESQQHRNIYTEVLSLGLVGFGDVIEFTEKKWSFKMICRAIAVIVIGLAQVILGAIVAIKSAGFMTHVSSGLISEGVSDILFAASALWSGNNFTWADYGRHKLESMIITAGAIGVGALLSRGVKFFKYGHKVAGNALYQGGKQVSTNVMEMSFKAATKEVVRQTATTVGKAVGFHLLRQGIETLVHKYLSDFCRDVGTKILAIFNSGVIYLTGLAGTLEQLVKSHGKVEAKKLANQKLQHILNGGKGIAQNIETLFNSIVGGVSTGISNAMQKRMKSGAKELEAASIALEVTKILQKIYDQFQLVITIENLLKGHVTDFNTELVKCCSDNKKEEKLSDAEVKDFQAEVVSDLKSALGSKAGKMIEAWTAKMLNKAAVSIVHVIGKEAKKVYRKHKEDNEIRKLRQLRIEERQRKVNEGCSSDHAGDAPLSEAHLSECMKIMKKTLSAKVFAEIVCEGVPMDRFCAQALEEVLSRVLNVPDLKILIDTTDSEFSHHTSSSGDGRTITLQLDREASHYLSGSEAANGRHDCMLLAVTEQLSVAFPGQRIPDVQTLRNMIADQIERSPEIRDSIERGWHQYTLNQNMFGGVPRGCGEHGIGDVYDRARNNSEWGISEADHQPAFSMFENAKDEWVRKLKKGDLPTLTIPSERHRRTKNYGGGAKSHGLYNIEQRRLMSQGDYKECIWHAINNNWLPWIKDQEPHVIAKYWEGLKNYCDAWLSVRGADGVTRSMISSEESAKLKSQIHMELFGVIKK